MSTYQSVCVRVHCTDRVKERMEAVYGRIAQKAYKRWLNSRTDGGPSVAFWVAAERELISKPATEVREWGHGVTVQLACPDVDPSKLRLFMSPAELLVLAPLAPDSADRWLFRYLRFGSPIDNADATAEFENGKLSIDTTFLNAPDDEKIHFRVA